MKATSPFLTSAAFPKAQHCLAQAYPDQSDGTGSIVFVDSTGLKVYGKDAWHQEKTRCSCSGTWRRLHLAIDENHHVLACELTTQK